MINQPVSLGILNRMLWMLAIVVGGCGGAGQEPAQPANSKNQAIHTSATKLHAQAVAFMLSRQNQDGSFGRTEVDQTRTTKTALVLYALAMSGSSDSPTDKAIFAARQKALGWLLEHQNSEGSFGSHDERVFATIMGIKALLEIAPFKHNRPIRRARAYLRNQHEYFAYIAQDSPAADLASCKMAWSKAKILPGPLARIYMDTVLPGIASAKSGWRDSTVKL